jgi:hypothetical protein
LVAYALLEYGKNMLTENRDFENVCDSTQKISM